jgi:zinc transport system substrate-binding protein
MVVIMKNPLAAAAAAALILPLTLSACSDSTADTDGDGTVMTSLYPVEYLAARLAGDHLEVVNLVAPGQEPHDFELSVRQTAELAEADVVVHLQGFQPAVDEAVEQNGPPVVLDVAEAADLRPADDHAHDDHAHDDHEHEDHEHGGEGDPHFWLDPSRMADVAEAVEQALAEVAPEHADDFAANLEELKAELVELDEDYRTGLAECRTRTVVVGHDAFGYLAKYELELAPIAGLSPGAEPSPAHLAELGDLAREKGVTTVFTERLASPETSETLAAELGLDTAVLDTVEGLSEDTTDDDYLSLMRANLDALRTANGCR